MLLRLLTSVGITVDATFQRFSTAPSLEFFFSLEEEEEGWEGFGEVWKQLELNPV